ncbi:MAG TPA: hypothetical protein DGU45_10855 [Planctomycetes bacterium]|nr:hypothetical protein [Planctomycetota bacterium]
MTTRRITVKIAVCIKRVPDTATRLNFAGDGTSLDQSEVQWIISPYDEFAIEEGLRLKEKVGDATVTVITCGPAASTKEIRQALGMGADDAVHITSEVDLDPAQIAHCLSSVLKDRGDDIVLFGRQSADAQGSQMGALVASQLGRPFANNIAKLDVEGSEVKIERDVDGGRETLESSLPIVLGADKSLNEPRYPKLKDIMKAKKKPIEEISPEDLGIDVAPRLTTLKVEEPPKREAGMMVESVAELVEKLKNEAKVI